MKAVAFWRVLVAGGLDEAEARKRSNAFASAVKAGIGSGRFELRGFGAFTVRQRAARTGRNPVTGQPIAIPARVAVAFKPSPNLKKKLAGSTEELSIKTPDRDLQWTAMELVKALLTGGDEAQVKVEGLGTFRKALRAARTGRNPATGEEIQIAASSAVLFKADPSLSSLVPGGAAAGSSGSGADDGDEDADDADEGDEDDDA